ncbi:MAG: hypothetical protein PSV16_10125 [Flavobacterium sp.]|nr:hypothetical protein [Flavobacterium sp.]
MRQKMDNFGRKLYPILSIGFFLANLMMQYVFFKVFFINPGMNGDENGYFYYVSRHPDFSISGISNAISQPYIFVCTLLNYIFHDTALTNRTVSLACGVFLLIYLFRYFKRHKFLSFVSTNPFFNDLTLFSLLFAVITIIRGHFVGTSDIISVAFAVPGFILLTETIQSDSRKNLWYVGLLFALAFTSRPTFLVILLAYLSAFSVFYTTKLFSKAMLSTAIFFIFFTALINFYPLLEHGKIVIDDKEPPVSSGTSWFEMNYLMAKKWDSGELPRTKWLSSGDVIEFKKIHPEFIFPKNHLDIIKNDTGMFVRQMLRMFAISMYSSIRFLYLLFPFLMLFAFRKKSSDERKTARFTIMFYGIALFLFMFMRLKMMEFRWMHIPMLFFAFYAMDCTKNSSEKTRLWLFNGTFLMGILFFVVGFFRDL